MEKLKKVLAVSSIGGHWIQLLRIAKPLEKEFCVEYMCTHLKCATMVEGKQFYKIEDFSRWNAYKILPAFLQDIKLLRKIKPDQYHNNRCSSWSYMYISSKSVRYKNNMDRLYSKCRAPLGKR